jgi:alpha-ketoglutarate-dependent 2,4-dichlorophenoxyacetate dioxygenase
MRAAYDALDEETRAMIEGLRVHHSIVYSRHVLGFDFNDDEKDQLKGAVHPLVRTIRGSGKLSSRAPRGMTGLLSQA